MAVGSFLLTSRVTVMSGSGPSSVRDLRATLLPLVLGLGLLFFNGRSVLGWLLTAGGAFIIFLGILMNLHIFFVPPACSTPSSCWSCWRGWAWSRAPEGETVL
jgi:hypothetical protein